MTGVETYSMRRRIKNPDFKDWKFMSMTNSGLWIYQNLENTEAAMVSPKTGEVLFIMDLSTKLPLYTSPNIKKYAKKTTGINRLKFGDLDIKQI